MRKIMAIVLGIVVMTAFTTTVRAESSIISSDYRLTFVKLDKMKKSDAKNLHPTTFTDDQIRLVLQSIKMNKRMMASSDTEVDTVFSDRAVEWLAPRVVSAFRQVTPGQKVVFSYLSKDPVFIIRNDRVTIGSLWVDDRGLHIHFDKLLAKVSGDYDKQGMNAKTLAHAKGLRIALDRQPSQQYGDTTDELIFNMAQVTSDSGLAAPERLSQAGEDLTSDKQSTTKPARSQPTKTSAERLEELKQLKDAGLITDREYEAKRKAIVDSL